jgi:hypothetical protein
MLVQQLVATSGFTEHRQQKEQLLHHLKQAEVHSVFCPCENHSVGAGSVNYIYNPYFFSLLHSSCTE